MELRINRARIKRSRPVEANDCLVNEELHSIFIAFSCQEDKLLSLETVNSHRINVDADVLLLTKATGRSVVFILQTYVRVIFGIYCCFSDRKIYMCYTEMHFLHQSLQSKTETLNLTEKKEKQDS